MTNTVALLLADGDGVSGNGLFGLLLILLVDDRRARLGRTRTAHCGRYVRVSRRACAGWAAGPARVARGRSRPKPDGVDDGERPDPRRPTS